MLRSVFMHVSIVQPTCRVNARHRLHAAAIAFLQSLLVVTTAASNPTVRHYVNHRELFDRCKREDIVNGHLNDPDAHVLTEPHLGVAADEITRSRLRSA